MGTFTLIDSVGTGTINARGIYNGYNSGQNVDTAKRTINSGTINAVDFNGGYTSQNRIWGELNAIANQSVVIKILDAENNVLGSTSLNNIDGIIDGNVYVTWGIRTDGSSSEYWEQKWNEELVWTNIPAKVELYADGVKVAENVIKLSAPDDLNSIEWWAVEGVKGAPVVVTYKDGTEMKYGNLTDAMAIVVSGSTVTLNCDTDEAVEIPARVKFNANGFKAENVIIEALQIKDIKVERNDQNNANVITITYINSEEITTVVIPDGKDGAQGEQGLQGKPGLNGSNGQDGQDGIDGIA